MLISLIYNFLQVFYLIYSIKHEANRLNGLMIRYKIKKVFSDNLKWVNKVYRISKIKKKK